jgi:hypothetical protein
MYYRILKFISIFTSTVIFKYIKLLGLVRDLTLFPSSAECLYLLYFSLVKSKLQYASDFWNSIMSSDANKLERNQEKITAL